MFATIMARVILFIAFVSASIKREKAKKLAKCALHGK